MSDTSAYGLIAADMVANPAPAPAPQPDDYAAIAASIAAPAAQGNVDNAAYSLSTTKTQPARAATVLAHSQQSGLAPDFVNDNLDAVKQANEQKAITSHLQQAPALAQYMQDPTRAALVGKQDIAPLSHLEAALANNPARFDWKGGATLDTDNDTSAGAIIGHSLYMGLGSLGNDLMKIGSVLGVNSPETEEHIRAVDQDLAEPVPGTDSGLGKVLGGAAQAAPMIGLLSAASRLGGPVGSYAVLFGTTIGPLYTRLRDMQGDDGLPVLTEGQARGLSFYGAFFGSGLQELAGGAFLKALPGMGQAIAGVGESAAQQALNRSAVRASMKMLAETTGHVASGAMLMATQSAVEASLEQLGQYKRGNGIFDWDEVKRRAADGFASGVMLAPFAAFEPMRAYMGEIGRISDAKVEAARIQEAVQTAREAQLLRHSPAEAEQAIQGMAANSDMPLVHVTTDGWDAYWHSRGADPEEAAGLVMGDRGRAYNEARASGTDLSVPIDKFLVRLAPEGHASALAPHLKLSEDGYTPADVATGIPEQRAAAAREALPPDLKAKIDEIHSPLTNARLQQISERGRLTTPTDGEVQKVVGDVRALGFDVPEQKPISVGGTADVADEPPSSKALAEFARQTVEAKRLSEISAGRHSRAADAADTKIAALKDAAVESLAGAADSGQEATATALTTADAAGDRMDAVEKYRRGLAEDRATEGTKKTVRAGDALAQVPELEGQRDFARAMATASQTALDEASKTVKALRKFVNDDDVRAELGKAGPDYLDRVDDLLAGFEFGSASQTEVARRQRTMEWIASEQGQGRDPAIPKSVLDKLDRFVHWKELTPQELRDLRSGVESIAYQAERKNEYRANADARDFASVKQDLIGGLQSVSGKKAFRLNGDTSPALEAIGDALHSGAVSLKRMEEMFREMDGGDISGPWTTNVWNPIKDGMLRWREYSRQVAQPIVDFLQHDVTDADRKRWQETTFKINGQDLTLENAFSLALNWGNDSNRSKVLGGWTSDSWVQRVGQPWGEGEAEQILSKLNVRDWSLVQLAWDRLETMWPQASALEQRLTGLAPPQIEASPFTRTLDDGTELQLRGGYYPVAYDRRFSAVGERQEMTGPVQSIFMNGYGRASTPQGHLQERTTFSAPVDLSIDALPRHIAHATKDIAMRESVLDVRRMLVDDDVRAAMQLSPMVGDAGEKAINGWLKSTVNSVVIDDAGAQGFMRYVTKARQGLAGAAYGFNAAKAIANLSNAANAWAVVPANFLSQGALRFGREGQGAIDWVNENSAEMRNRSLAFEAGIGDAIGKIRGDDTALGHFTEAGYWMMEQTDKAVAYPVWLGALEHGRAGADAGGLGLDEGAARRYADQTVRLNVYSSAVEDLPPIMRSEAGKWVSMFYGFSNIKLNQMFAAYADGGLNSMRGARYGATRALVGTFAKVVVGSYLWSLLAGHGPESDDGGTPDASDWAWWGAKTAVTEPFSWFPVVRDIASAMESGRDASFSPLEKTFNAAAHAGANVLRLGKDEYEDGSIDNDHLLQAGTGLAEIFGRAAGLPVEQARQTFGYGGALYNGDEQFGADAPLGALYGKKRKGSVRQLFAEE